MFNNLKILIITCVLLSIVIPVKAQQMNITCAGKNYCIPSFNADTLMQRNKIFEAYRIIQPIRLSKYDIEIRAYFNLPFITYGCMAVVTGNSKTLTANTYYHTISPADKGYLPFKPGKGYHFNIYVKGKPVLPDNLILDNLIKNKITILPTYTKLLDNLKRRHVKLKPSLGEHYDVTFEVKINNRYRNFTVDPFAYRNNTKVPEFANGNALVNEFIKLYNAAGQPKQF